jgi:polysaccharide biosynthesis protein PslG
MIFITVKLSSSGGGKGDPISLVISDTGSISGTAEVHRTLLHSGAVHTGDTLALQWVRNGAAIDGATGDTYTIAAEDDGAELKVRLISSGQMGKTVAETEGVRVTYMVPVRTGDLAAATLIAGQAASLDFAAQVSGEGGSWSIASGAVPEGMTRSGGLVSGTPVTPQSASTLVLCYTNSGGKADVACAIAVRDATSPPVPTGALRERLVQEGTGKIQVDYAKAFAGELVTYALVTPPTGVSIDPGTGIVTFDTHRMSRQANTVVTIRAKNAAGSATNTFKLTCGPQIGVVLPSNLVSSAELFANGTFSSATASAMSSLFTTGFGTSTLSVVNGALRITNGSAAFSGKNHDIPVIPGRSYRVRGTVKGTGTAGGKLTIRWGEGASEVSTTYGSGSGGADVTCDQTVVPTRNFIRFSIASNSATSGACADFDNFYVTEVESVKRDNCFAIADKIGAKYVRCDFSMRWIFAGSATSRYWSAPDDLRARAVAANLRVLFVMTGIPDWAVPSGGANNSYPAASQLPNILACIRDAAARYKDAAWEFLNEQNIPTFAAVRDPEAYMDYAARAIAAIREVNPNAVIISNGLSAVGSETGGFMFADTYLKRMYAKGVTGLFNGVGFHPYFYPYTYNGNSGGWNGWGGIMEGNIRNVMTGAGDDARWVWMTEVGGPTGGSASHWTETQQGDYMVAAWKRAASLPWAGPFIVYAAYDRGAEASSDREDHFGICREDGTTDKYFIKAFEAVEAGPDLVDLYRYASPLK